MQLNTIFITETNKKSFLSENGFHVMIIGKTGNGKSTLGNSLLNTAAFRVTRGLATSTTQTVTASAQKDGLTITVRQCQQCS